MPSGSPFALGATVAHPPPGHLGPEPHVSGPPPPDPDAPPGEPAPAEVAPPTPRQVRWFERLLGIAIATALIAFLLWRSVVATFTIP